MVFFICALRALSAGTSLLGASSTARVGEAAQAKVFSAGGYEVTLNSSVKGLYSRPANATNQALRAYAQEGKVCSNCGANGKMVADHIVPLMKEFYETRMIDIQKMKNIKSIQPQCISCSNRQGAYLSNISKQIKEFLKKNK
jgi:hypothetical protein